MKGSFKEYFIHNPVIDKQIAAIKRKIYLRMNGETSEKMTLGGILYEKNYGLAINQIEEIAGKYQSNMELSDKLFALGIRETMMLSFLLAPTGNFSKQKALERISMFRNYEIASFSCSFFEKLACAEELMEELILQENKQCQAVGLWLAAKLIKKNEAVFEKVMLELPRILIRTDIYTARAASQFMKSALHTNKENQKKITDFLLLYETSELFLQRWLYEEVMTEINYGNLDSE